MVWERRPMDYRQTIWRNAVRKWPPSVLRLAWASNFLSPSRDWIWPEVAFPTTVFILLSCRVYFINRNGLILVGLGRDVNGSLVNRTHSFPFWDRRWLALGVRREALPRYKDGWYKLKRLIKSRRNWMVGSQIPGKRHARQNCYSLPYYG